MSFFWTFFWSFLLSQMLVYVVSSMQGGTYAPMPGVIISVAFTLIIVFLGSALPGDESSSH